jgi:hypothetical protein
MSFPPPPTLIESWLPFAVIGAESLRDAMLIL